MEAPKLPSFIRQNQHKRFEFKPRYYDERKERLEEMRKKYRDGSAEEKHSATDMRLRMSTEWRNQSRKTARGSNLRLAIIAMALILITYLILFR